MENFKATILTGYGIQLEPINLIHEAELYQAAQHEIIWTYHASNAFGEGFYPWFAKALQYSENKQHLPFIVRRLYDQTIIGSTRYYDICVEHKRLAIGNTWYIPEVWGSYVNSVCKYLLLKYAFEDLQFNRVEFKTDLRNERSQGALRKLGAKEEGILRQHMILENGFIRDSVAHVPTLMGWSHPL